MAGDYTKFRRHYQDVSTDFDLLASDAGPDTLISARNKYYTIYVQRITVSVKTFAAHTLTFQDSAGTPVVIGVVSVPAAESTNPGLVQYELDFGEIGTPLTVADNLVLALSAAGVAARIHIDAYQRMTATGFIGDTAANQ